MQVFGAMLSEALKVSDHFYGTGESFLFTFFPEFKARIFFLRLFIVLLGAVRLYVIC